MSARETLLEDEFVRAPVPGLRLFSVGILKLARKLDVATALPPGSQTDAHKAEGRAEADMLVITWLLDARHSLQEIREAADAGRAALDARMEEYEFGLSPALFNGAKLELSLANAALEMMLYKVAPKPSTGDSPAPPGNS